MSFTICFWISSLGRTASKLKYIKMYTTVIPVIKINLHEHTSHQGLRRKQGSLYGFVTSRNTHAEENE